MKMIHLQFFFTHSESQPVSPNALQLPNENNFDLQKKEKEKEKEQKHGNSNSNGGGGGLIAPPRSKKDPRPTTPTKSANNAKSPKAPIVYFNKNDEDGEEEEEQEDYEDDQFFGTDSFAPAPTIKQKEEKPDSSALKADKFFTGDGSKAATERLIKDLNQIMKGEGEKFGYSAEPVEDNLYLWEVHLFGFEKGTGLEKDLKEWSKKNSSKQDFVKLSVKFPKDYPFTPPFVRVISPRFKFHTGHVTVGGSICMELLTTSGWRPINDIESILVQIRAEMVEGGARLDFANTAEYSEYEAQEAFTRVAQQHGWN